MNFRLLWDWEQASGFDAKQAEEMRLERDRFGQFHEPRGGSSLPHPAGDFTPGGEFPEQALEAVHGESIRGSSGTSFLLSGGGRFRFGDGVAFPPLFVQLIVLEEYAAERLPHMPFDIVRQEAEKDIGLDMVNGAVMDRADAEIESLEAAERLFDLTETLIGPDGIRRRSGQVR